MVFETVKSGCCYVVSAYVLVRTQFRCTTCRFLRDLAKLKQIADYECCDPTHLDDWLKELGVEFRQYTYQMLKSGVDRRVLRFLSDEHLLKDCGIVNGIHRLRILESAKR